jgi:alpha-L-fucosidase 2
MGLYMLASASREGGCATSLHGLWSPDSCIPPAHGFYIWDFYSQHWGLYTANHLEIGEVFCDHFLSILPRLKEETRSFYGWDGVFVPGFMIVDGSWIYLGHNQVLIWPGTSAWVAQAFWWQYLYNNDVEFLRLKAYPFMRECMLFYEGLLEKSDDGKYHLNVSYAPEFASWIRDDTLSLAVIRYLIDGLLKAVEILQNDEPHLAIWQEIAENLQAYHVDGSGLMFGDGLPYTESHRHMSHLGPVYPCDSLNIDGSSEDRQLIDRTINNVILKGYGTFVGWAFVWLSAIAARAGRGQMAWWTLKQFADAFVPCNTYNLNLDWERNGISIQPDTLCVDGNLGAVDSLNQMLVQSWGGRIRVFPACPSHWREVRFDNLRCEGGVVVSAVRSEGRTLGVRLESASGVQVRLSNPFDGSDGYLKGQPIQPDADRNLVVNLSAGQAVWMTATAEITATDLDDFTVKRPEAMRNPYGLKYLEETWLTDNPDIPNVHPHFRNSFL